MKNYDCKLVQDLLPNYIENLTSEETNRFIEKHIEKCEECEQMLKDMKGEIKLDKINNQKKINALKKVRNRFRLKLFIFLIIVIIINIIGFYLWNNYRIVTNDDGTKSIERYTFSRSSVNNDTNIIIKTKSKLIENTIDGYVYRTIILTINEKGKCVNYREKIEGYTKEGFEEEYNVMLDREKNSSVFTNIKMSEDSIYYNNNTANNMEKEKIVNLIKTSTEVESVEEY